MGIHDDDIAKVRAAADLVELIGEHTQIKRSGRNWMARCPLHGERTPSLSVSQEKGVYHCFGCKRNGDAITFVQEIDNLDFVGAVEALAARYGVRLRYTNAGEGARRARKRTLLDAVAAAADFYHQRLLTSDDAKVARSYLRSRDYDGELVRRFRIGWAPDGWDQLARRLSLSDKDLRDAGLGFVNRRGRQQDAFRARVMFPISDERGDCVGFGGRILPGHEGPKYYNTTTEAVVYDKSKVLYGLHDHRDGIVRAAEAIICEGYTDVIGFAVAGIDRAVATCGTALTEEHVKLLKRFSASRLILAFDADEAGIAAAERVHAWEAQYDLDVRVADLPAGVDPDDLARRDPARLRQAVENAVPLMRFRMDRSLGRGDMSTVEGRARAAAQAKGVVDEHPDPLVREQYLLEIADRCRVDAATLREMRPLRAKQARAGQRSAGSQAEPSEDPWEGSSYESWVEPSDDSWEEPHQQPGRPPGGQAQPASGRLTPSDEALRLAIQRPEEVDGLLFAGLFEDRRHGDAFRALADAESFSDACRIAGPEAGSLLRRLAVDSGDAETADVLARMADLTAARVMDELRRRVGSLPDADDRRACAEAIGWLKSQVEQLPDRDTRAAATAALLRWLNAHLEAD